MIELSPGWPPGKNGIRGKNALRRERRDLEARVKNFLIKSLVGAALIFAATAAMETPPVRMQTINIEAVHDVLNPKPVATLQAAVDSQDNKVLKLVYDVTMILIEIPMGILACVAPGARGVRCPAKT